MTATAATGGAGENGPIRDIFQAGTDWVTAELALQRHIDHGTDQCMRGLGYAFRSPSPNRDQIRRDGLNGAYGTDLADTQYRRLQGYGVTSGLVGIRSRGEAPDPVGTFTKGMSRAQEVNFRKAWSGCSGKSAKKFVRTPSLNALFAGSADLDRRIDADSRMVAARSAWSRCMATRSHPAKDSDELMMAIEARARPLYGSSNPDKAAAARLHAEELATADVDWTCRSTTITPTLKAVRNEIEGAYVEAHPELVAKVREEMKALIGK